MLALTCEEGEDRGQVTAYGEAADVEPHDLGHALPAPDPRAAYIQGRRTPASDYQIRPVRALDLGQLPTRVTADIMGRRRQIEPV